MEALAHHQFYLKISVELLSTLKLQSAQEFTSKPGYLKHGVAGFYLQGMGVSEDVRESGASKQYFNANTSQALIIQV